MANRTGEHRVAQPVTLAGLLAALLFTVAGGAQEPVNAPPASVLQQKVALEVFHEPKYKHGVIPEYPLSELRAGVEGWVDVAFMVSPAGKPYEFTVLDSSGDNKVLHESAFKALEKWTFEPAKLNGEPIESALTQKFYFRIDEGKIGANQNFAIAYKAFSLAIDKRDRAKADEAKNQMVVKNLYEDAYFGLVQFMYADLWGTEEQQLAGLRRAVAAEQTAKFLPKALFAFAVQSELVLELRLRNFGSAMDTWKTLQSVGVSQDRLAVLKPTIDKILASKEDGPPYKVSGQLVDGSWNYILFKRKFRIDVSEGHLSQIKLRCNTKYVFIQYDPKIQYTISDKYGTCGLELLGDPQTKFELTQS